MNLKNLSDDALLIETKQLVKKEREVLTAVLHHLREIERRRLFSREKLPSLFVYCQKELGYSEYEANARITAMRLLRDLPEVEKKVESGELTLTNLVKANSLFRRTKATVKEQKEILKKLENKSTREAEKIILKIAPETLPKEKQRAVSPELTELRLLVGEEALANIEQLKGLLAHSHPGISLGELVTLATKLALETLQRGSTHAAPRKNKCERCHSTYALQTDHKIPKALGGTNHPSNLRTLCRNCNQRAAIEILGLHKMEPYLRP